MLSLVSTDTDIPEKISPRALLAADIDSALGQFQCHVDFVEIRIPIKFDPRICRGSTRSSDGKAWVEYTDEGLFDLDLEKLAEIFPGLKLAGRFSRESGENVVEDLHCPWESIPSSLGSFAIKIFSKSNASQALSAHLVLKFNPSKNLYGFNGVSDVCDLETGLKIGLSEFARLAPRYEALCDISQAVLLRFDTTSGLHVESTTHAQQFLLRLSDVQHGHTHAAGALPKYAADESRIGKYRDSVYFNPTSEWQRAIGYWKQAETQKDLADLRRQLARDPQNAALAARIQKMESPDYQAYVEKLVRLEGRMLRRGLMAHLVRLGHEWTGNVWDLVRIERELAQKNTSIVQTAWAHIWRPQMTALWGDPDMGLRDTAALHTKLYDFYQKKYTDSPRAVTSGYRRAKSVIDAAASRGYQVIRDACLHAVSGEKSDAIMSSSSWYKTLSELKEAGVSIAALQALDGSESAKIRAGVVVSIRDVISCQAVTAVPAWFQSALGQDFLTAEALSTPAHQLRPVMGQAVGSPFSAEFSEADHDFSESRSAIDSSVAQFSEWLRREPSTRDFARKISGHIQHLRAVSPAKISPFGTENRSDWSPK